MNDVVEGLQPTLLWHHFLKVSQIPRCSGHEEQVRSYVLGVATRNGAAYKVDNAGNVVITCNASAGLKDAPLVVLQSHLDMVCEKQRNGGHDFSRDPIRLKREGDWITAEGTTLGADNGIGVAAALAVLEHKNLEHGPLELLFTVDEESGLTGATALEPDMLEGRILINMDTEEEGAIYIGCAGGRDTEIRIDLDTRKPPQAWLAVGLKLGGLKGGHSGLDIHRGRANAIKLLARFLWKRAPLLDISLAAMEGGSKHNAIPRESGAIVLVPAESLDGLKEAVTEYAQVIQDEYYYSDPDLSMVLEEDSGIMPDKVLAPLSQKRLLNLLYSLPHGIVAMNQAVPGLVQTSTNLAVVRIEDSRAHILTSQRSSVSSQLTDISDMVSAVAAQAGAQVRQDIGYPAWKPNLESPLLKTAKLVFDAVFKSEPAVKAVHAGLECGIIGTKFAGMDMISFGPTILGAHSPYERIQISTVKRFWDFLAAMLKTLAKQGV